MKRLFEYFCPGVLVNVSGSGITPDKAAEWGLFALLNASNKSSFNPVTVDSAATAVSLTAAQLINFGVLLRTGAPGGAVADTLDTAANIIAALGGPSLVLTDGTFSRWIRMLNFTGQTITITTNTGLVLSGTMTIATSTYRDFLFTVTNPTTVTILNIGAGTI